MPAAAGCRERAQKVWSRVPAAFAPQACGQLSVSGTSVVPVCWPLRLHAVSPCLIANTFTFVSRQQAQTLSASVERTAAAAASCPHLQPVISGISSPYRAIYSR